MTNLLRSQIYKLFHNMIFWAGAALTICSVLFYALFESMKAETVANGMPLFQYYSILFQNYSTGLPVLIFCVVFASDDFMSGAVHYYISKGISRIQYYLSKMITCAFAATLYVVIAGISGTIISQILWHNLDGLLQINTLQLLFFFFSQIILHASYASFLVFTCFLFRSSVISSVVNMFLLIFGFYIVHRIEDAIWNSYVISMYWPVAMFQRVQVMTVAEWFSVVAAIFVIHGVLLTCIGIIIMKKRDIK